MDLKAKGIDEQKIIDMCFIAYLKKSKTFNYLTYQEEVEKAYNMDYINQLVSNYSEQDLKKAAKEHNKSLDKYHL